MSEADSKRTCIGLLNGLLVDSSFPKQVSFDGFRLERINGKIIEGMIRALGEELSREESDVWRNCQYALVSKYDVRGGSVDQGELSKLFRRFTQMLRVVKSNVVVCEVVYFDGPLRTTKNIQYQRTDLRGLYSRQPAMETFTKHDSRVLRRYHTAYEAAAALHKNDYDRLGTAFYFFESQFHQDSSRIRIVNAVSALEALFNIKGGDVTYTVSLNCAFFMEKDPKERFAIIQRVKEAYKLRSQVVHGGRLSKALYKDSTPGNELIAVVENFTRYCLQRIIDDKLSAEFTKPPEKLLLLFEGLVAGSDKTLLP